MRPKQDFKKKVSIRTDKNIEMEKAKTTGGEQVQKSISTDKGIERMEATTQINFKNGHTVLMFKKSSICL